MFVRYGKLAPPPSSLGEAFIDFGPRERKCSEPFLPISVRKKVRVESRLRGRSTELPRVWGLAASARVNEMSDNMRVSGESSGRFD